MAAQIGRLNRSPGGCVETRNAQAESREVTENITRKQHILSATLQRQWVDDDGKIADCKVVDRPSLRVVKPERTGYVYDYLPPAIANDAEAVWRTVEEHAPEALADGCAGSPSADSLELLVDLVALHLARSHRSKEDWDVAISYFARSGIHALLAEPGAGGAIFRERTGLYAAGPEAAAIGIGFAEEHVEARKAGLQLAEFTSRFTSTRDWLRSQSVAVRTSRAPLLVGDDPVVLFGAAGLVRSPGQASCLTMPIGPFAYLECPSSGNTNTIDDERVEQLNVVQVQMARERAFSRPEDEAMLSSLVTKHRDFGD